MATGLDLEKFFRAFGGRENIVHLTGTVSRIDVQVVDTNLVSATTLKILGVLAVVIQDHHVQLVLGEKANAVLHELEEVLNLNS